MCRQEHLTPHDQGDQHDPHQHLRRRGQWCWNIAQHWCTGDRQGETRKPVVGIAFVGQTTVDQSARSSTSGLGYRLCLAVQHSPPIGCLLVEPVSQVYCWLVTPSCPASTCRASVLSQSFVSPAVP
ncbi:unnamed protein product [Protopolystoma xenopodis]|uniref:Uncharacterized protein n=1 Tax=Protopolystoma xenopodis TaxID=117903 RepID=A0A448XSY5_9PLAT|nr:unnamed protein product [Protopolystoma xenopodis]